MVNMAVFWGFKTTKIDFTYYQSCRKILKFPDCTVHLQPILKSTKYSNLQFASKIVGNTDYVPINN